MDTGYLKPFLWCLPHFMSRMNQMHICLIIQSWKYLLRGVFQHRQMKRLTYKIILMEHKHNTLLLCPTFLCVHMSNPVVLCC